MTLRDDLIPVVDGTRTLVSSLGLRLVVVKTVTRTWSGGAPGRGTATDVEVTLTPAPKVRPPSPHQVETAQGRYEEGDQLVTKISATYTEAQLDGGSIGAAVEFFWTLDGEPYRLVGLEELPFEWRAQLRRMRNR